MLKKTEPSLTLAVAPSARLNTCLIMVHVFALTACMANALPIFAKVGLVVGVIIHFLIINKRLKNQCWTIRHSDAFGWQVFIDGQFETIQILYSTVITTFVILLHFQYKNGTRCHLAVLNDALTTADYRQFIVRLKTTQSK